MTIDDKLAGGLMNRYMRELYDDGEKLRAIVARERIGYGRPWEATVRRLDTIIEAHFEKYVVSKILVLDKKRSSLEALVLLPVGPKNLEAGSFLMTMIKADVRSGLSVNPLSLRASFHWTKRIFQRRRQYDPAFVRQELRAALLGLSAMGVSTTGHWEVPSLEGATALAIKETCVETITYLTDRQATPDQSQRWGETRTRIAENLGMSSWSDVMEMVRRPSWVAKREKGVMTLRPRLPWMLANGETMAVEDHPLDGMFIGVCGYERDFAQVRLVA